MQHMPPIEVKIAEKKRLGYHSKVEYHLKICTHTHTAWYMYWKTYNYTH